MTRTPLLLLLLLTLTAAGLSAYSVRLDYFQVVRANNDFQISWQSEVEDDVQRFELFRKTAYAADFTRVQMVAPHGVGKEYRFTDDQVYKSASEQVDYRLDVVFTNGLRQQVAEQQVNYTPTAIRRTWGSIKAMFQ